MIYAISLKLLTMTICYNHVATSRLLGGMCYKDIQAKNNFDITDIIDNK